MTMQAHDRAAILSIGDELAIGQSLDTNAMWVADRLTAMGIRIVEHRTIADDLAGITAALTELASRVPAVIATGGLGPTADDLTRRALADAMGEALVEDAEALQVLEELEHLRKRVLTPERRSQALRPASASCIANPTGSAPGLAAKVGACDVFCLPGPPREMHPMFETTVVPALHPPEGRVVRTRILRTFGLPESDVAARLGALMARDRNPVIGTTASGGIVSIRMRAEGAAAWADTAMRESEAAARAAAGEFIFAEGDTALAAAVLDLLRAKDETVVVAESCTAGLLGSMIGAIPGASDCFFGGWITYANSMKYAALGVPMDTLDGPPGAVSKETARALALGALHEHPPAHHALAITGIAGPGGGTREKPVGTVCIARASRHEADEHPRVDVRVFLISGDRDDVRERAAITALGMLWHHLAHGKTPRLVWEVAESHPG